MPSVHPCPSNSLLNLEPPPRLHGPVSALFSTRSLAAIEMHAFVFLYVPLIALWNSICDSFNTTTIHNLMSRIYVHTHTRTHQYKTVHKCRIHTTIGTPTTVAISVRVVRSITCTIYKIPGFRCEFIVCLSFACSSILFS